MEDLVTRCKNSAVWNMEMFLRNFSHVPDDKLEWSPAPTAKSALQVAAHTALYAGRFAKMIADRKLPSPDNVDEWVAQNRAEERAVTQRDQIEPIFRRGTDEVLAALDSLTPEEVQSTLDTGQGGSLSMAWLMQLPGWHATLHTGQIDFLQTCWGDEQIYL